MSDLTVLQEWVERARELLNQRKRSGDGGGGEGHDMPSGQQDPAVARIAKDKAAYRQRLINATRALAQYKGEPQRELESAIGPLVFEVERLLQSLGDRVPDSERTLEAAKRTLEAAQKALQALKKQTEDAEGLLETAKTEFKSRLAGKQKPLDDLLVKANEAISKQKLAEKKAQEDRNTHAENHRQMKDGAGRNIQQALEETSQTFYAKEVTRLEALEAAAVKKGKTLSKEDALQLSAAKRVVAAGKELVRLDQSLSDATALLGKMDEELERRRKLLEAGIESVKLAQEIRWAVPAPIVYGTPLDAEQLNASLSADSGRIEYRFQGQPVVAGQTLLPAGEAQLLEAVVLDSDTAVYQAAPPKTVPIQVSPAKVTLSAAATLAFHHGTPFNPDALAAQVVTEPALPGELAAVLSKLVCKADGQVVKPKQVLDAKAWTLRLQCPANGNFAASNEVTVALTVHPAEQDITWAGAAPTTITFGAALTKAQLNATAKVTSDPPLNDQWAALTAALEYVDDKNQPVKVGTVLDAGPARRITVRTPVRANFKVAPEQSVVFQVAKAVRTLSTGTPPAIGAVVQSNDLKRLQKVFRFTAGKGTVDFFVDKVQVAPGAKLKVGKKAKLRVAARVDDNYQPTAEQNLDIEVQGFADSFQAAKNSRDLLTDAKVHTQHKDALDKLKLAVEALAGATEEEQFAKVNALREEIDEIETNLVTWKGPVPSPSPKGDVNLLRVDIVDEVGDTPQKKKTKKIDKTIEAVVALIKHGGIKLADIEKLVPSGSASTYSPSPKYPIGFKYIWTTPSGLEIEIYGHRATVANNVDAASDSKKGNLVRVKIAGEYLKPDGTRTAVKTDATSHMPLY